jgi:3-hydroxybutyryl-CoA dehydrogenase
VTTVAIIGAGPLGRRLALSAGRSGFSVFLEDVLPGTLHHAREYIRQQLSADALGREPGAGIRFVSTIEDAVRSADLVIDCVPDELESKLEILWLLDRMAPPRTVFATPTTRLSIADLAACTYRPEKCVAIAAEPAALADSGANSGHVLLRATPATAPEALALVTGFWRRLGFTPCVEPCVQQAAGADPAAPTIL